MRILYGVQTTGNGHISRSREIVRYLKASGHDVHVILSGRKVGELSEMELFEPYDVFRGLTIHASHGRIKYLETAADLDLLTFYRDIHRYDAAGFDLVITDFEPISARIARRCRIPSIGMGHQYAFCYDIPMDGQNILTLWLIRHFARTDIRIGFHWHHFNHPVLPPVIPSFLTSGTDIVKNKIVVYLPFEDPPSVKALLRRLETHQFYIYGGRGEPYNDGNLCCRPFSRMGFLDDLMSCEGVICNAGFQLPSEVLHLGKKLLVRPLSGQMEQESNALAITQLNLGRVMDCLDREVIARWLACSDATQIRFPNVAEMLADWIGSGCWRDGDVARFAQSVWQQAEITPPSELSCP